MGIVSSGTSLGLGWSPFTDQAPTPCHAETLAAPYSLILYRCPASPFRAPPRAGGVSSC